jgi:hypothetical protein
VRASFADDAPDDVEPVGTAVEGELRLGAAFRRQRGHAFGIDVRRIGDDQIVALAAERSEEIAAVQRDAVFEAVFADIARGDRERVLGNVHGIDSGARKMPRGEDGEAAGAGAEVEHAFDIGGVHQRSAFAVVAGEM